MKKRIAMLLAGTMLLGMLAACGGDKEPTGNNDPEGNEPYKIALIAPLTGSAAEHGNSYKTAIEYKLEEINAAGGIAGRSLGLLLRCENRAGVNLTQTDSGVDLLDADAAAILEEMSNDLNLVAAIIDSMQTSKSAAILQAMKPTVAAQITTKMTSMKK